MFIKNKQGNLVRNYPEDEAKTLLSLGWSKVDNEEVKDYAIALLPKEIAGRRSFNRKYKKVHSTKIGRGTVNLQDYHGGELSPLVVQRRKGGFAKKPIIRTGIPFNPKNCKETHKLRTTTEYSFVDIDGIEKLSIIRTSRETTTKNGKLLADSSMISSRTVDLMEENYIEIRSPKRKKKNRKGKRKPLKKNRPGWA